MGTPNGPEPQSQASTSWRKALVPPLVGVALGAVAGLLKKQQEACGMELQCLGDEIVTVFFVFLVAPVAALIVLVLAKVPRGPAVAIVGTVTAWAWGLVVAFVRSEPGPLAFAGGVVPSWTFLFAGLLGGATGQLVVGPGRRGPRVRSAAALVAVAVLGVVAADHWRESSDAEIELLRALPVELYAPDLGPSVGAGRLDPQGDWGVAVHYRWEGSEQLGDDVPICGCSGSQRAAPASVPSWPASTTRGPVAAWWRTVASGRAAGCPRLRDSSAATRCCSRPGRRAPWTRTRCTTRWSPPHGSPRPSSSACCRAQPL